jgi:hypothetical protein
VPCPQEGRSIRCQGHLEADAALILGACPRVTRLQEQPLRIWYAWRPAPGGCQVRLLAEPPARGPGKNRAFRISYIVPDFLVEMAGGPHRLMEVKPARKLGDPVVRRKLAVARLFAERRGWSFHALTEQEIRRGPLLANLRLLRRYRHLPADARLAEDLAARVPGTGVRLGELVRPPLTPAGPTPALYPQVLHLLCVGRLSFDPGAQPVGPETLLFPKGAVVWDPFASAWAPSGCSTGGPTASCGNSPPTASSPSM